MVRAFVAIVPPSGVLDDIADTMTSLALPDVRTTTRPQWHVTLQFLGDADVDAVAGASRDLRVASGVVRLGGAGAFPARSGARSCGSACEREPTRSRRPQRRSRPG